jgi:hypothetical protein
MDDLSARIDHWLSTPGTHDFTNFDISATIKQLDRKIVDAWEHDRDDDRKALLKLREELLAFQDSQLQLAEAILAQQPAPVNEKGFPCFQNLSQALKLLAECFERGTAGELFQYCAHHRRPQIAKSPLSAEFMGSVFSQLKRFHQELDFRVRYQARHFPEDARQYTLGGHMAELGCIHIEFYKTDSGWLLDDIWVCR